LDDAIGAAPLYGRAATIERDRCYDLAGYAKSVNSQGITTDNPALVAVSDNAVQTVSLLAS
jgi:hypothetical protein